MSQDKSCDENEMKTKFIWNPCPSYDSHPVDITLEVERWQFRAHKYVLERSSDYFKSMFSSKMVESRKDSITLNMVLPEPFKVLLEGMYSGNLKLTESNIASVAELAQMLQMCSSLNDQIHQHLRKMINIEYGLEVLYLCQAIILPDICCYARQFCLVHFSDLRHTQSFANLSLSELCDYLSDKSLVVEEELHVIQALQCWLHHNEKSQSQCSSLYQEMKKIVAKCVYLSNDPSACDVVAEAVLQPKQNLDKKVMSMLGKRPKHEDLYMFWSQLTSTRAEGLVDIVKLDIDTGQGVWFDSMTAVVEQPGFDLGTAVCSIGPYVYLSGGGPKFGNISWIRKIWRFDVSKQSPRWDVVGDLIEFRRHHAMIAVRNKLYIFGGFGKYRVRNQRLHSFDISTDTWEELPPMPVYEVSPAATAHHHNVYYADRSCQIHCFRTVEKYWFSLTSSGTIGANDSITSACLSLHSMLDPNSDCLVAVIADKGIFRIAVFQMYRTSTNSSFVIEKTLEFESVFSYEGSVMVNGKLLVFLSSKRQEEFSDRDEAAITLQGVKMCDLVKGTVIDLPAIQNVRKALAFVALPQLSTNNLNLS